jgi:LuxR family transcriptional regulator, maltose regulon positive regulatory protein
VTASEGGNGELERMPFESIVTVSCRRPPPRAGVVPRDDLVKPLVEQSVSSPIVTVRAPAGYGKTTLLTLWDEADPRDFAWVHLGPLDNNPVHLLRHIGGAFAQHGHLGDKCVRLLSQQGRQAHAELVPALLGEIERRPPSVLVLDDMHLVESPATLECIGLLTAGMPAGSTVCLSGRSIDLPLARQRVNDQVVEIVSRDLTMSVPQAAQVFAQAGLDLDDDDVSDLYERTEGWPAGLHLAALALSARPAGADHKLSGRDRLVGDYLVEETLAALPTDLVEFLERSSVLGIMTGDALDEVLDRSDSRRRLHEIERSGNLFLIPLDDERRLYRYHHLFRELLRSRLEESDSSLATHLERRASEVCERRGDLDDAIRHAVRAGDRDRAAGLVLREAGRLAFKGEPGLLRQRVELIGIESLADHPEAAVAWAWCGIAEADRQLTAKGVAAAERWRDAGPLSDGSPTAEVAMACIRSLVAADGIEGVIRDTTIARAGGPPESNPWWGLATAIQGSAYSMLGQRDLARDRLATSLMHVTEAPAFEAAAMAHLALLDLDDGDLTSAERLVDRALAIADRHNLRAVLPAVSTFAATALVTSRCGRRADSMASAADARSLLDQLGLLSPRTAVFNYLVLAQAALALGDPAEARLLAAEADRARRRDPSATFLNDRLDRLHEQLDAHALSSAAVVPLTPAEVRVLTLLPTHLSLQEIAAELLISRNTAKSHSVAIYRKLGVSSRTQAVAEARRLGLLGV